MNIFLLYESREDWIKENKSLKNVKVFSRFLASDNEVYTIKSALVNIGFNVILLDYHKLSRREIFDYIDKYEDAIFWNLTDGADFFIGSHFPSFLHLVKKPYIGSPSFVQTLCQDKHLVKEIVSSKGILTPSSILFSDKFDFSFDDIMSLSLPLFVKPSKFDNSIGMEFIKKPLSYSYEDAIRNIEILFNNGVNDILIEEAKLGKELTVACIHVEEWIIVPLLQKYNGDYISSYSKEKECGFIREQSLLEDNKITEIAKELISILDIKDYCRIDLRYDKENKNVYLLEINTGTFLTSISFTNVSNLYFNGFEDMFEKLVNASIKRQKHL